MPSRNASSERRGGACPRPGGWGPAGVVNPPNQEPFSSPVLGGGREGELQPRKTIGLRAPPPGLPRVQGRKKAPCEIGCQRPAPALGGDKPLPYVYRRIRLALPLLLRPDRLQRLH